MNDKLHEDLARAEGRHHDQMTAPGWRGTPGPWQVGVRHKGNLKLGPTARLHFVGPDGDAVTAVFYDTRTGQGLVDAKGIAAVPQLVEALASAPDRSKYPASISGVTRWMGDYDKWWIETRDATLKAAGVTP
jgi:hypothetical protein